MYYAQGSTIRRELPSAGVVKCAVVTLQYVTGTQQFEVIGNI